MSHPIGIFTDSTCDIPQEWIEQYLDGVELPAVDFYQRILTDPVHPHLTAISQGFFGGFSKGRR